MIEIAIEPKTAADQDKMGEALRRLAEEDPTLLLRRDQQTAEQLLSGMSQMHEAPRERFEAGFPSLM